MPGHFPLSKNSPYWGRFSSLTVNARSLEMTRCNWPCRPMKWLVPGMLWIPNKNKKSTWNIDHNPYPFFFQVDKHIRRLDTDLARFEADLKEKQIESTDYDSTSSKGKKGACGAFLLSSHLCSLFFGCQRRLCEMLKWVACKFRRLQTEGKEDG